MFYKNVSLILFFYSAMLGGKRLIFFFFRARFTSFHTRSYLLTFYFCFFVLFHSCCSRARVFGKTLVSEFHVSNNHTELYFHFLRGEIVLGRSVSYQSISNHLLIVEFNSFYYCVYYYGIMVITNSYFFYPASCRGARVLACAGLFNLLLSCCFDPCIALVKHWYNNVGCW